LKNMNETNERPKIKVELKGAAETMLQSFYARAQYSGIKFTRSWAGFPQLEFQPLILHGQKKLKPEGKCFPSSMTILYEE